ncbi:MAG: hypothetical protein EOP47_27340 [Sphingobacteriaceae bacterium]|nr:MAG: hypothetical protein EOP47_27340 [Sphingobacteriaceae bacterium]
MIKLKHPIQKHLIPLQNIIAHMDNDQYPAETEQEEEYNEDANDVEIYSKQAILGFSIFFSTIFGGVLMMQNLRDAGYKKMGYTVLAFSIAYTLLAIVLAAVLGGNIKYIGMILNLIGSAILTEYFFNKYFPGDNHNPKPIWRALAISVLIMFAITLLLLYVPGLKEQLEAAK